MKKQEKITIIKSSNDNLFILQEMSESKLFPDKELYAPIIEKLKELKFEYTLNENIETLLELKSINLQIQSILEKIDFKVNLFQELNDDLKKEKEFINI